MELKCECGSKDFFETPWEGGTVVIECQQCGERSIVWKTEENKVKKVVKLTGGEKMKDSTKKSRIDIYIFVPMLLSVILALPTFYFTWGIYKKDHFVPLYVGGFVVRMYIALGMVTWVLRKLNSSEGEKGEDKGT